VWIGTDCTGSYKSVVQFLHFSVIVLVDSGIRDHIQLNINMLT
jgi:hypothetical protein